MPHFLVRVAAWAATLACIAPCAVPTAAIAAGHRLNDTGIGLCIDADGQFIDCKGTGQDAAKGRDVTHPRDDDGRVGFHFTRLCNSGERAGTGSCPVVPPVGDGANEWGCTRDDVTNLLWETKTDSGRRSGSRAYTFYSPHYDPVGKYGGPNDATGFVDAVNTAGLCGLHDWRLPVPTELMGIVDMGQAQPPAIDLRFMPNTQADVYWAAGDVRGTFFGKELGWSVDHAFGLGDITAQFREMPRPVRLVHGPAGEAGRFIISSDHLEVADRQTGLTWRRCIEGLAFDGSHCAGSPLAVEWTKALAYAKREARDTGVAWRLPNVKEMASLLTHVHRSHIDSKAFPDASFDGVWTSSSFPTDPTPRCVAFNDGISFGCSQGGNTFELRLVRDSP